MSEELNSNFDNTPSGTERLGAVVCHAGTFLGLSILIPLIFVLAVDKEKRPFVYQHAKQALVFQIIILLIGVCLFFLFGGSLLAVAGFGTGTDEANATLSLSVLLFFLIIAILAISTLILICIASYKAIIGQAYKYPFLGRL